jgi:hypothetical protein
VGDRVSLLSDVREVIAERIKATGLDSEITVNAYEPDAPAVPCVNLIPSDSDAYVSYHGTFGDARLVTINLVARVIIPKKQSAKSAAARLDEFLSTGESEGMSIADLITANDVPVGDGLASIYVATAENFINGVLDPEGERIGIVTCDLPITVQINRS